MKRALAVVAVLALTACGSTAPKPTAEGASPTASASASVEPVPTEDPISPSPTVSGSSSASATAVSSVTATPGATSAATSTAAPVTPLRLGVVASDRVTFQKLLTSRGQLGGRPVAGIFVSSCAELTGVDLALVQGDACPGTSFPVLAAGPAVGQLTPALTSVTSLSVDDRLRLLLTKALDPKTGDLGVVVEACPIDQQAVTKTLTPVAKQRGFTVTATASVPCGKAVDGGKAVAALQANKVAQVVFVSADHEAALVRAFTKTAKAKAFAPVYGVTSATVPALLTDQREKVVGIGWSPSLDTTASTASVPINDCRRALRKAGAALPTTPAQRFTTYTACDLLGLADRVLRLTRGATDATAVRSALKATGRLFKAASVLDSATDFRTRQTGPASASRFAWSPACGCVQYTGSHVTL